MNNLVFKKLGQKLSFDVPSFALAFKGCAILPVYVQ